MKIYTKFGDKGKTSLFGGSVVSKSDLRVAAYGDVDELNAILGTVVSVSEFELLTSSLTKIQNDLVVVGAELSSKNAKTKSISPIRVGELEQEIDALWEPLPHLSNFILPGGSKTASLLHLARTVCRRAERNIVALSEIESVNSDIIMYINRVGDLLFTQARYVNYKKKIPEIIWKGK